MPQKNCFQRAPIKPPRPYQRVPLRSYPLNWGLMRAIDQSRPLSLEVGCGTGEWIYNMAHTNPKKCFIGIEKTLTRSRVWPTHQKPHPRNLILLRANAIEIAS